MFVNGSGRNEHFYRGPSIDASYQISVHLAKQFQRRCLKCETSETAWPNELKFGWKHLWKVLYKEFSFLGHLAKGSVSFWHHLASIVCR
jgi:hypothetical protein